jgi:hypothetical protein
MAAATTQMPAAAAAAAAKTVSTADDVQQQHQRPQLNPNKRSVVYFFPILVLRWNSFPFCLRKQNRMQEALCFHGWSDERRGIEKNSD